MPTGKDRDTLTQNSFLPLHIGDDRTPSAIGVPRISTSLDSPGLARSKPIAIELPTLRKINTAPAYTPPEPLSARGDLPGGYFPLHEDPNKRVHRPHPFHADAKTARHRSISLAAEQTSPDRDSATPIADVMSEPAASAKYPLLQAVQKSDSQSHTPVTSYVPSGANDKLSPLPVGKYYPSNYEKRRKDKDANKRANKHGGARPQTAAALASTAKSEPQVPTYTPEPTHNRPDSEAKRRLQQYQRDMVAQATLAASEVLGSVAKRGGSSALAAAGLHGVKLKQFGASLASKPTSPRLVPLGSPGPVTPMELGDTDASYLTRGLPGPDADREADEVARAIRDEAERKRKDGTGSPIVELGPISF